MKLIALATLALTATATAVTPPTQSKVTGFQTLIAIGNVRGIKPALTIQSLQALRVNTPDYRLVNTKLRISPQVFSGLLSYGNRAVPTVLATQAVLESAIGKSIFEDAVAKLIAENPTLAAIDTNALNNLLRDPDILAAANDAAEEAAKPVTPTTGKP